MATPFTAATTGLGMSRMIRCSRSISNVPHSVSPYPPVSARSFTSPPAQKARSPAPVRITQATAASAQACLNALISSSTVRPRKAFIRSGRSMVTTAHRPSTT